VTSERLLQPEKHFEPTESIDEGMQIDESDEQPENTASSRRESFEPGSNMTVTRQANP
jgi:hypothetical protein